MKNLIPILILSLLTFSCNATPPVDTALQTELGIEAKLDAVATLLVNTNTGLEPYCSGVFVDEYLHVSGISHRSSLEGILRTSGLRSSAQ